MNNNNEEINLKNLIYLSSLYDINIFNNKKKFITIKPKEKILKECDKQIKKEVKTSSCNLVKISSDNSTNVKNICTNLETKINNINNIINCVNTINIKDIKINRDNLDYIEYYSN
jgi:hypothetical protein